MRDNWVRLPTQWIQDGGLQQFQWAESRSDATAALIALVALAHNADQSLGLARVTYDVLCTATGLSRAKLSHGLDLLERFNLVGREASGRSSYQLVRFDPTRGWAKLPARRMYDGGRISAFADFRLRSVTELNALKLYLLFVARRDRKTNMAHLSYDKIEEYAAILRPRIKAGISLLVTQGMLHVEHLPRQGEGEGIANGYRIVGIEPTVHMGTSNRGMDPAYALPLSD